MYTISILAMFKNESMIIKNWIEHYLREGVEHFYLIDNGSNDDYEKKIEPYKKHITLKKDSTRLEKGTQSYLMNTLYLDQIKKETKWIIVCDIDEYIYGRNGCKKIIDALILLPPYIQKIWIPWKIFGSNGNIIQPKNIIQSFTKRKNTYVKDYGCGKCISKTIHLKNFGCCGHDIQINTNNEFYMSNGEKYENFILNEENCKKLNLQLNHYMMMSLEYYQKIKCTRGGGESGLTKKYTIEYFQDNDKRYNIVDDDELLTKTLIFHS